MRTAEPVEVSPNGVHKQANALATFPDQLDTLFRDREKELKALPRFLTPERLGELGAASIGIIGFSQKSVEEMVFHAGSGKIPGFALTDGVNAAYSQIKHEKPNGGLHLMLYGCIPESLGLDPRQQLTRLRNFIDSTFPEIANSQTWKDRKRLMRNAEDTASALAMKQAPQKALDQLIASKPNNWFRPTLAETLQMVISKAVHHQAFLKPGEILLTRSKVVSRDYAGICYDGNRYFIRGLDPSVDYDEVAAPFICNFQVLQNLMV